MKNLILRHPLRLFGLLVIALVLLMAAGGGLYWLNQERNSLIAQVADLSVRLKKTELDLGSTTTTLLAEQAVNASFSSQIENIQGTVGDLDKLSKTDPELLRRYSQVYFLSDTYVPSTLVKIPDAYVFDQTKEQKIQSGVWDHLEKMLAAATKDSDRLVVVSGYRSFGEQGSLKTNYQIVYGTGANSFSADQGYSEHQLGTAVDLTTVKLAGLTGFDRTDGYAWLVKNAYRYGFILSYPEKNVYYQFEPWHWRFVGVKLATYLHDENKFFFTLPQHEINTYLLNLFGR